MAYIAVKNTEHKGVYKEKDFNKDLYKTKGISHRRFKEEELNEALEWAKVKDVKSTSNNKTNKKNKKKESKEEKNKTNTIDNEVHKIIMDYKNQGCEGICLVTKNLGEIILKLNDFAVILSTDFKNFDENKSSLYKHYKDALEEAMVEAEKYSYRSVRNCYPLDTKIEIVKFERLSEIKNLSSQYIKLDNFWASKRLANPFESKDVMLSRIFEMSGQKDAFWNSYNNLILNCDEIIAIQPLNFTLPNHGIGDYFKGGYYSGKQKKIKMSEVKDIEKIFRDAGDGELINLKIINHQ